jgi:hypothetical protein
MVTLWVDVYVPAAGEITGVPAGRLMVNAAEATALFENPVATAIASMVSVDETVIAPLYRVDDAVGIVPFVV